MRSTKKKLDFRKKKKTRIRPRKNLIFKKTRKKTRFQPRKQIRNPRSRPRYRQWSYLIHSIDPTKKNKFQEKRNKPRYRQRKKVSFKTIIFFFYKFPPLCIRIKQGRTHTTTLRLKNHVTSCLLRSSTCINRIKIGSTILFNFICIMLIFPKTFIYSPKCQYLKWILKFSQRKSQVARCEYK